MAWKIVPQIVKDCEVRSKIINWFPITDKNTGDTKFKRIAPVVQITIKHDASDGIVKLKWTRRSGFAWQSPAKLVQPTIRKGTRWFPDPDKPAKMESPEPIRYKSRENFVKFLREKIGDLTETVMQEFAYCFDEIG